MRGILKTRLTPILLAGMLAAAVTGCSIINEASGKNDDGFEDILKLVNQVQTFQKFQQGLDWANFVSDVSAAGNLPTTAETDDTYPGTAPVSNETTGACYIDNTGSVSGFDMCCYNIKQSDCFNVSTIFSTGYDFTFVTGSNEAAACTGNGFSQQVSTTTFSCFTK